MNFFLLRSAQMSQRKYAPWSRYQPRLQAFKGDMIQGPYVYTAGAYVVHQSG